MLICGYMKRLFPVSVKAVLLNSDKSKALLIHMDRRDAWGLPGGHVDDGETPDEAIVREIYEECGVKSDDLTHADFFMHSEGKLILAYVGTVRADELKSPQHNLEGIPKWLTKDEFDAIGDIEAVYRKVVNENWS